MSASCVRRHMMACHTADILGKHLQEASHQPDRDLAVYLEEHKGAL